MGLDSVNLVLAIEEEFGLDIPNEELEKMSTVGDFYQYLRVKLGSLPPAACLSQKVFYKLRRALIENYGVTRRSIEPETRMSDLLPLKEIEAGWPYLEMFVELKTPNFKVANELLGFRLTDKTLTMRELVTTLMLLNAKTLVPERDTDEELWHRLVRVFVEQTNISPEKIKPEARIARDLGID